jgi:quercetin dioxygenase-like cupin family protein
MFKLFCLFVFFVSYTGFSQSIVSIDTLRAPLDYEGVFVQKVFTSLHQTSFVISIKTKVKKHKHLNHTELIQVLEGTGNMTLGKETFKIKQGDFILIPENTVHSVIVTSTIPLKVLSIQTPEFDGSDRIWIED